MPKRISKAGILSLSRQVAMEYLNRHAWTPEETVLILNLLDPNNRAFFKEDGPNPFPMTSVYWESIKRFNPKNKPLEVGHWLKWAIERTDHQPRTVPLSYGLELLAARKCNDPTQLDGIIKTSSQITENRSSEPKLSKKIVTHQRRDLLTNLILKAQESVADKWDANQIFIVLQKWAREKQQSSPLIGVTEEGVQWYPPMLPVPAPYLTVAVLPTHLMSRPVSDHQ
jgi:hypothetical protein